MRFYLNFDFVFSIRLRNLKVATTFHCFQLCNYKTIGLFDHATNYLIPAKGNNKNIPNKIMKKPIISKTMPARTIFVIGTIPEP